MEKDKDDIGFDLLEKILTFLCECRQPKDLNQAERSFQEIEKLGREINIPDLTIGLEKMHGLFLDLKACPGNSKSKEYVERLANLHNGMLALNSLFQ